MSIGSVVLVLFIALVLFVVVVKAKTGSATLDEDRLAGARVLRRVEAPDGRWDELGSRTEADGLRVRFDHDDDPEAAAWLLAERPPPARRGAANARTIRLQPEFSTHHVHTRGHVFRLRLRGTGRAVGKEVEIKMWNGLGGAPHGGVIGLDDDDDVAMGDWIEVEWAEILGLDRA